MASMLYTIDSNQKLHVATNVIGETTLYLKAYYAETKCQTITNLPTFSLKIYICGSEKITLTNSTALEYSFTINGPTK